MSRFTRRTGVLLPLAALAAAKTRRVKALIIDGFSNHDWRKTTHFISSTLTESGCFNVTISTSPDQPADPAWAQWRPAFSDHDLVVLNMNNIQQPELHWPEAVEQELHRYVSRGGGLLVYHSANNAFPHWPEYDRMIGLGWRKKEHGWALKLDANGDIERIPPGGGESTSHGPRQDTVVMRLNEHAINRGMPSKWLTPDIEVYCYARGPAEDLRVLTYGQHHATKTYWPLEWVVKYGRGRVYSSSFGHIWKTDGGLPDRVRCVGFQTTLIRAAQWASTGKADYPIPADFPTEKSMSIRRAAVAP